MVGEKVKVVGRCARGGRGMKEDQTGSNPIGFALKYGGLGTEGVQGPSEGIALC